ncbi:hypothetical protein P7C71_g4969, partial [Lecanoromycetidae sp. Uapishka_2]
MSLNGLEALEVNEAYQSALGEGGGCDTNKALPPPPHGSDLNDIRSSPPHYGDYNTRPSVDERYSSQSARPSTRDLHDAYEYKPKVKLGPRPSMESQRSPDGSHRSNDFRPVASLPAGVRMPSRKVVSGRPVSRQAQGDFHETMSPTVMPPPPPRTPITPIQIPDRKLSTHSNGLPTPLKTPESIAPKMTPEKRRLMKALELRQKQLAAQRLTSGPGNEAVSDKQASDFVRPEVDDVVLNAILEANSSKAEPDLMHIAVRDLSKEEPRNLEVSPISIAETSEGPSTQASSITDEEDTPTHKIQDHTVDSKPSVPDLHGIRQADHDHGHLMSGTETSRASGEAYEYSATNDPPLDKGLENTSQSPERALLGDQHQVEQKSLKTEKSPSMAVVFSEPAKDSLLTQESQETPMVKKEQQGVVQSTSATSCDQYLEEGAHGSLTGDALEESAHSQGKIADSKNVPREQQAQTLGVIALDDSRINRHDSSHHSPLVSSESSDAPANEANARETPRLTSHEEEKAEFAPSQVSTSSTTITEVSQPIADEDMKSTSKPPEPLRAEENAANLAIPALGKEANRRLEERQEMPPTASVPQNLTVEADSSLPPSGSKRQSLASDVTVTQPPSSSAVHERSIKRQGVIKSVERMSSAEQSDEHFLSDDSFMDELHSATVQEAKPVSVSKSPIKPVFPRSESQQRLVDTRASRSVSSPMNAPRNNGEVSPSRRPPTAASVRSFSASHAPRPDEQAPAMPLPKKIGVSSGISQRIKALEQSRQTNRPTSPQSQTSTPSPTAFINLRKNAQRSPPEVTNLNRNQNVHNRPSTAYPSPSPSPDYVKWNPFSQSKKIGATRPDSVSVTATIIRDKTSKTPEMPLNPSEPRTTDLHQSPLVIEHQETKPPPPLSPLKPPRPRYARYSSARSGSSSSTDQTQKLEKPPNSRRDSFASIRSKSSRAGSELELPRSISDSSLGSPGSPDSGKDDRKDSKRSRLMKRMSSISSMSRRSIAHALSPGPKESPILESQEPIAESPLLPSEVEIGDVNVQFPDTLIKIAKNYPTASSSTSSTVVPFNAPASIRKAKLEYSKP